MTANRNSAFQPISSHDNSSANKEPESRSPELADDYKSFLNILRHVTRLGPDGLKITEDAVNLSITMQEYLEHLYEKRRSQDVLRRHIDLSQDILCFVGERGAGKSSIGHRVADAMATHPRTFVAFIDIRTERVKELARSNHEWDDIMEALTTRIRNEYLARLFPESTLLPEDPTRERIDRVDLLHFFLTADDPPEIFRDYLQYQESAHRLHYASEPDKPFLDWLRQGYVTDERLARIVSLIESRWTFPELSHAAFALCSKVRQVLWIDNIDGLPVAVQPDVVQMLRQQHARSSPHVRTVIAVREENIFRDHAAPEVTAPPFLSHVLMRIPDEHDDELVDALDLTTISNKALQNLLLKRLAWARQTQARLITGLSEELAQARQSAASEIDPQERTLIEKDVLDRENTLNSISPAISNMSYGHITSIIGLLAESFRRTRAIYVANNSIRDLLEVTRDLLRHFLLDEKWRPINGEPPVLRISNAALDTYFYAWVRHEKMKWVGGYDYIQLVHAWFRDAQSSPGCMIPYLIITTTWNLILEEEGRLPRVDSVIARIARLGHREDAILKEIFGLYHHDELRGHIVDFKCMKHVATASDIDPAFLMYVTPRGKALAGWVFNTFGYCLQCIKYAIEASDRDMVDPPQQSLEASLRLMIPHLCDMASMHFQALRSFRLNGTLPKEAWLDIYYRQYGLPQIPPFAVSANRGRSSGGTRRMLQLEALCTGILNHTSRVGSHMAQIEQQQIATLLRTYKDALKGIESGDTRFMTGTIDFKMTVLGPVGDKKSR